MLWVFFLMACSGKGCCCSQAQRQDNVPTFPTMVVRLSLVVGETSDCSRSRRLLSLEITATLKPARHKGLTLNLQWWWGKGHGN